MTVRALDSGGDIVTSGPMQFIGGAHEVGQTIKTRLALFLGEYFRNIKDGTPWYEQILGKNQNLNIVEAILRNRIAQTPDVIRLTSFSLDFDVNSRSLSVSAGVLTTFGLAEVEFNGPINA